MSGAIVTIEYFLQTNTRRLAAAGIDSARLDCLLLLEDAIGKDRGWLLAHPEYQLSDTIYTELNTKITQRETHIPLAYIRGRGEFYGQTFVLDEHVLVPRPETEAMLELLLSVVAKTLPKQPVIVDIGTGSGVLAISAKLALPQARVYATDIDAACLELARKNAVRLTAGVTFMEANVLQPKAADSQPLPPVDVILANLPYVPNEYPHINQAARHEPGLALFGGTDGLDVYRTLCEQIACLSIQPGHLLCESLPEQHIPLTRIIERCGYKLRADSGLIQLFEHTR